MQYNFLVLTSLRLVGALLLVLSILMIRNLEDTVYAGQIFITLSLVAILSVFLRMGADNLIVKIYAAPENIEQAENFKNVLTLSVWILGATSFVIVSVFESFLIRYIPIDASILNLLVFAAVCHAITLIYGFSLLAKGLKYYSFVVIYVIEPLIVIATAYSQINISNFIQYYIFAYAALSLPLTVKQLVQLKYLNIHGFLRDLRLGGQYFVMGIAGVLIANTPIFLGGILFSGPTAVEIQSSLRLSGILGFILPLVIARDLTLLVRHFNNGDISAWRRLYRNSIFTTNILGLSLVAMVLMLYYIQNYLSMNILPSFSILMFCFGVQYLSIVLGPVGAAMISMNKERYLVLLSVLGIPSYLLATTIWGGISPVAFIMPLFVFQGITNFIGFAVILQTCRWKALDI